jgi:GT2 family glycosyltransferase
MVSDSIDVSIILINYKTHDLVKDCLDSIQAKSSGFSYEVIIVDNSNDEKEFEALKEIVSSYSNIRIINPKENCGTSKGNNIGAKAAQGKYLLLLNSDTLLIDNAILELLNVFKEKESVGAVGANLYSKDGSPTHSYVLKEGNLKLIKQNTNPLYSFFRRFMKTNYEFNRTGKILPIKGYICAAAVMIPQAVYWEVGGDDERIFMYGEDDLLCAEIRQKGYGLYNTPAAKIIHLEGASDQQVWSDFKVKNYVHGAYIRLEKIYGKEDAQKGMALYARFYRKAERRNKALHRESRRQNAIKLRQEFESQAKKAD